MARSRTADDDLAHVEAGLGSDLDTLVVFNLLRTNSYLAPFIEEDLRQQSVTPAQLNAILALRHAGPDGLLMGELGARLVVTKSNVTGLVDRLERQGLARRVERQDRRATAVQLTDAGEELVERVAVRHAKLMAGLTGDLRESEKLTLIRLLTRIRRDLRRRLKGKA